VRRLVLYYGRTDEISRTAKRSAAHRGKTEEAIDSD
jgi:hypothetical protein